GAAGLRARRSVRAPTSVHALAPCHRAAFSSKSDKSSAKLSAFDGVDGIIQYANRCTARLPSYERYKKENVFPPSGFDFLNFFLFIKLQLPTSTEIDACEFLNGAQFACDLTMNTMYLPEFVNYATGAITESPAAETLRRGLSPECFDAFLFGMRESSKIGNSFELKKLDINGVFLHGVEWERMTLAELRRDEQMRRAAAQQDAADPTSPPAIDGSAPADDEEALKTMVERMRIDVLFESKEHLHVRMAEGEDQDIIKDSQAVWRFESLVTQPSDVDWRIVSVF
ncbi:TPA: hypothetical protein N0F65_008892, partial [Lagenidium giganteum]